MQWDKVKNILLVILLAVNVFLAGNLLVRQQQSVQRTDELSANIRTLLAADGRTLDEDFALPEDKVLPQLTVDRSRSSEQETAMAVLGADVSRTEDEEGTARYENDSGYLIWSGDGTVQGTFRLAGAVPADEAAVGRQARRLFRAWGVWTDGATVETVDRFATLTAPVAGMPVHNRSLTLYFDEDGAVQLTGFWSFGTPYAYARETGVTCAAADALLAFAASDEAAQVTDISAMTVGYRLQVDSSGRLQLVPTWKIQTDAGEYLVDCDKKTPI